MKILHIIRSVDPRVGGPIEGIKQLSKPNIAKGFQVEILSLDAPESDCVRQSPIRVHAMGPGMGKYGYSPRFKPWLSRHFAEYDAFIVNGIWQYHSLATRAVLTSKGLPYYVFTHGMLDPWFKRTYPFKHLKKWLYWPWAEYRVLRDARAVIFTCEEERLLARQSFWLYRANEVVTNYGTSHPPGNGDELAQRFLVAQSHLQGKRIVLFLSRIQEKKGCDLLLDAFAQIAGQDARLHLLMAGPDQTGWAATLQAQAQRLGIADRISWPGMLQGDDKWGAFYASEVFCLPSHQENFGIVVAEALACGKPVLISDKVNIWREIEADAVGFVDTDTVEGTVRNLQRWLALDSGGYAAKSERARQCFATRFHIQQAAERLSEIIWGHG